MIQVITEPGDAPRWRVLIIAAHARHTLVVAGKAEALALASKLRETIDDDGL